jgi:hypothetical protein
MCYQKGNEGLITKYIYKTRHLKCTIEAKPKDMRNKGIIHPYFLGNTIITIIKV